MEPGRRADELAAGADDEPDPRRSRLGWLVALLVGALAVAFFRPDLALHAANPAGRRGSAPTHLPTRSDRPLSPVAWDTRGDLASDRAFVSAAVARIRRDRPDVARVFFAGRLPDGSRLVLAGTDVDRGMVATAVHALLVEQGSTPDQSQVTDVAPLTDPQQVLAWASRGGGGRVFAVALSRPGPVRFELSASVVFRADGTPRRLWTPVYTEDGVVVADLGTEADPVITVRATGSGVFPVPEVVKVASVLPPVSVSLTIGGVDRPDYRGPEPALLSRGLELAAGSLANLWISGSEVVWSGAPWAGRKLALVRVTRPDGVRLQALVGEQDGKVFAAGVRALPRDAPQELPWLLEPFSPQDPTYLLCPSGAGTLVYRRGKRPPLRIRVPADGALALIAPGPTAPSAGGARVTLLDPAGRLILRTTLPRTGFDDPLSLAG